MIGSQNSASFGRSVLCLPLIKFSFATVNPDMSSIPWEHRHSKDMFVLIEHDTGTGRPALQLRVIEASNTVVRRLQQTNVNLESSLPID